MAPKPKVNPIPTSNGLNQPIYSYHVTQAGRNRVKCPSTDILSITNFTSKLLNGSVLEHSVFKTRQLKSLLVAFLAMKKVLRWMRLGCCLRLTFANTSGLMHDEK